VPEANETVRADDALAVSATGPWSTRMSAGCANVIVCASGAAVTANDRDTGVAAAYAESPVCVAVIVHVPDDSSVAVAPDTVHTLVVSDERETARPLDADAVRATGPSSTRVSAGCANEIVWAAGAAVTVNDFATCGAAS
jgi:hypothetical protein